MNWIRDNILKILIILGVCVIVVIIAAFFFKPKGEVVVSGTKYGELETRLQNAAIKYVNKHKKLLPTTTDTVTKIKLNKLQGNNYIGTLVAVDNSSVKCDGYVEITKISDEGNDYRYTPFISCGKYYVTKTIGDYIIDAETKEGTFERTTDAGLYKMGDEYIFRGELLNNYIKLDDHLYRIIKIDNEKHLQLISTTRTAESYIWDDRYNVEKNRDYGVNDFVKSRLHESLNNLYSATDSSTNEIFFTDNEKDYIVEHDYCIGKRNLGDTDIYSGTECKETLPLKVGLITLNEYVRTSIDSNCKGTLDKSCGNYNFIESINDTQATLTGVGDNTFEFYKIAYGAAEQSKASKYSKVYPVIYINNKTIYSSGTGTFEDPYIVR